MSLGGLRPLVFVVALGACTHTALPESETHLRVPTRWVLVAQEPADASEREPCRPACARAARADERGVCAESPIQDYPARGGPRVHMCKLERLVR